MGNDQIGVLQMIPHSLALLLLTTSLAQQPAKEIATLHVLIAVDTDDAGGATWGRDGANMKALIESSFQKQKLAGRFQIEVFTDKNVTAEKILGYYRSLKIGPDDGLLFYYSGHGGFHIAKGHFLALTRGLLDRKALIDSMEALKPRLCVVLTDCCANYAGGAFKTEPKGEVVERTRDPLPAQPRAANEEPPSKTRSLRFMVRRPTPRPVYNGTFTVAKVEEPPASVEAIDNPSPRNFKPAKDEEPQATVAAVTRLPGQANTLTTGDGRVSLRELLNASDGVVLRDLCFRNAGLVDINGSEKGAYSFGTLNWGGSLFTNALIATQKKSPEFFDRNKNQVVEWAEVFPTIRRETEAAGRRVPGKVEQTPEATSLGSPIK